MRKILLVLFVFISSVSLMAQTSYNWVPQTISPGNNLQEMKVMSDNSLVVVGSNNTFFKSTDNGESWNQVNMVDNVFNFTALSIAADGTGLLATRRGKIVNYSSLEDTYIDGKILKTTDFGASWSAMDLSGFSSDNIALDPNKVASYGLDIYELECIDANNAFAYVGWYDILSGTKVSNSAVYQTIDGGTSWTPISENLGSSVVTGIQTSGATTFVAGNKILFKKSGETITDLYPTLITAEGGDETIYIFDIDVISETEFYVVTTTNGLFHSIDGGATITKLDGTGIPAGGNDIKAFDTNTILVLGTSAKSKVTTDGGANWVNCYPGASCWEIAGVLNDSVVALAKNNIYKIALTDLSADPSKWVSQVITDLGSNIQQMEIINETTAILSGYSELIKSTSDKGLSWTEVSIPELFTLQDENAEFEVDFNNTCTADGVSYAAARRFKFVDYPKDSTQTDTYFSGPIFMSTDNWESWELLDIDEIGKEDEADVTVYPFNDNCYGFDPYTIDCVTDSIVIIWAQWYDFVEGYDNKVTHSRIFKSSDKGETWKAITEDLGSPYVTDIHFIDKDNGYIAGNKTLLKTTDGGATFENLYPLLDIDEDDNMFIKKIIYIDADEIYLPTTSDGVWKLTENGSVFTALSGISGTNDFLKLEENYLLALGSSSKSFLSKDNAQTWEACYPGSTVWSIGGIINDEVLALTKGDIYKIPVAELVGHGAGVNELVNNELAIKILNRYSDLEIVSLDKNFDQCVLHSITGKVLEVRKPNATSCVFNKSEYPAGVYIISTFRENKKQAIKVVF